MTPTPDAKRRHIRRLLRDESGQDLAEYVLLAALIAVVLVVAVTALGSDIAGFYERAAEEIP